MNNLTRPLALRLDRNSGEGEVREIGERKPTKLSIVDISYEITLLDLDRAPTFLSYALLPG